LFPNLVFSNSLTYRDKEKVVGVFVRFRAASVENECHWRMNN
jgi:hypothetical protein